MEFFDAIKLGFKKYADFRGRSTRPEYWWFFLFAFLVSLIGGAVDMAIHQSDNAPVQSIINLGLFLPQLALMVRRNRDAGFSALWLLAWLIPVGLAVYGVAGNPDFVHQIQLELVAYQTQEQTVLAIANILAPVFGPALLSVIPIALFFFIISLLPSRKAKPPVVASIDY